MKRFFATTCLALVTLNATYAQELKDEVKELKAIVNSLQTDVKVLQSNVQKVLAENMYLKQVIAVQEPISEYEGTNTSYRITKVEGDTTTKTIFITMFLEAKNEDEKVYLKKIDIVDVEGNEVDVNLLKSSYVFSDLSSGVPKKIKLGFTYADNVDLENGFPSIVKIFRFSNEYKLMDSKSSYSVSEKIQFRDLRVEWE